MKAPPKALKVLGKTYSVDLVAPAEVGEGFGECNVRVARIKIADNAHPDQQRDTLLHEVLHALDHEVDTECSERQIRLLATGLLCVLLDNKSLVTYLTYGRSHR